MNYQGQPKPGDVSQHEQMAKSKLASYVYEYLVHSNAPKAAEAFKNEVLVQQGNPNPVPAEPPGFLVNWFSVFWDLYSAAPERRDKYGGTAEARGLYDYTMMAPGAMPPMMNGLHGSQFPAAPPNGMGLPPGAEGMMPAGFYPPRQNGPPGQSSQASPIAGYPPTTFAGAPARFGGPPNAGMPARFPPGGPMYDMRMAAAQRMQPNARMPTNFPAGMRPMRPGSGFPGQFIESPSGTPPFQNPMMPNGVMCSTAPSMMSSPGPGSHPGAAPDGSSTPHYNPMMGMPGVSGMPNQFMPGDGVSTPTSSSAGPTSVGGVNGSGMTTDGGPLSNLLNGESSEMKQSPASVHGGSNVANGGTLGGHGPGSQLASATGPGSAAGLHGPSSVQSQPGAPNSVAPNSHPQQPMSQQPQHTPTSESMGLMDFQQGNPGAHGDEAQEISKIKASLIDDFPSYN